MSAHRLRVLAPTLVVLAGVALLLAFGLSTKSTPAGGRLAPALPSETLSGPHATLTSLLNGAHGHPALIVFWASWCDPCKQEAPAFERFYHSAVGRGRLIGVDWSDPEQGEARAFIAKYHWTFPVLRDSEGAVGNRYGLSNLPNTFVIDTHGRIRKVLRGPQTFAALASALAAVERS